MTLSRNCQTAQGRPNREHVCTAGVCTCSCHAVGCTPNFRELVEAAKSTTENEEGACH